MPGGARQVGGGDARWRGLGAHALTVKPEGVVHREGTREIRALTVKDRSLGASYLVKPVKIPPDGGRGGT